MSVPQVAIDSVNHYLSKGISKDVAVGIVSVLYAGESRLNPGSQGSQSTETGGVLNSSGAYGIASWNGPRQKNLQDFAAKKNLPVGDINTQLDFVLTECANSYPAVWAAIQKPGITYADFIQVFVEKYEVPAQPAAEIARAKAFADALYPAITGVPAPTPVPVPSAPPAAPPTPVPVPPSSVSVPPTIGFTMDPVLAALLTTVVEAVISGLIKTSITQITPPSSPYTPATPLPPTTPDLTNLLPSLISLLVPQIQTMVAAEISKLGSKT